MSRFGRRAKRRFAMLALAMAGGVRVRALDVTPVYKAHVLGGQYFLTGQNRASLSGNAAALAAPLVTFNERWQVLPSYTGDYYGTKGVSDGVAAGTLFQQRTDHKGALVVIYSIPETTWRLKSSASHKWEFLKETLDEKWTKGLFDYRKAAGGFEVENIYKDPFSYRIGADFYRVVFPNYKTLESQVQNDPQGNPLNRELASKNVLDTYNYQFSAGLSLPVPYDDPAVSLSVSGSFLYQKFIDQKLIDKQGQVQENKPNSRRDFLQTVSAAVAYPKKIHLAGREVRSSTVLTVTGSHNGSNQNTFDAARTRFIADAYSYYSYGMGPSYSFAWGNAKKPAAVSLSAFYNRTQYVGRLAQNSDGLYIQKNQWQDRYTASMNYLYPLASGLAVKAQTSFYWATSNQAFEKTYLYTYRTVNYLLGFTYEY